MSLVPLDGDTTHLRETCLESHPAYGERIGLILYEQPEFSMGREWTS